MDSAWPIPRRKGLGFGLLCAWAHPMQAFLNIDWMYGFYMEGIVEKEKAPKSYLIEMRNVVLFVI